MTAPDHAAAVQIAAKALRHGMPMPHAGHSDARRVVAALARHDLLAGPGELAALRAVADAVRATRQTGDIHELDEPLAALNALPPAGAPAVPPGEDVERLLRVWRSTAQAPVWHNDPELAGAIDQLDRANRAVPAGPQPADD